MRSCLKSATPTGAKGTSSARGSTLEGEAPAEPRLDSRCPAADPKLHGFPGLLAGGRRSLGAVTKTVNRHGAHGGAPSKFLPRVIRRAAGGPTHREVRLQLGRVSSGC